MKKQLKKGPKIAIICIASFLLLVGLGFLGLTFYILGYNANAEVVYDVSTKADSNEITIMSTNCRCLAIDDIGDKSWFERAPRYMQVIANNQPDIICFQEVSHIHKNYIDNSLAGYDYELLYRQGGAMAESTPIYFNTSKFNCIKKDSFWLSETPNKKSKDWGAANYRVCSFVILEQKSNGKQFIVFNTHLDNKSEEARIKGIDLVLSKIAEYNSLPALLLGDMNDFIGSTTYNKAIENFDNSRLIALEADEDCMTWHGFDKSGLENTAIDYCFVTPNKFDINSYKVIKDKVDGHFISDHYPIKVIFTIK